MRTRLWWLAATLALGVAATGCGDGAGTRDQAAGTGTGEAATETVGTKAPAENGVVYVDVRTPAEYASGHIEGALLIPYDEMGERYEALEPYQDREIVVYCRSGRRSGIAKRILEEHGFDNVTNGGGLRDLLSRGVPGSP